MEIPELTVAIHYDVILDDIEEDFLIDTSMLHYAQVHVKCNTQELYRRGKTVKGVARIGSTVQGTKSYRSVRLADSTQV